MVITTYDLPITDFGELMLLSETTSSGFLFLAPWLVFFPVIGLLVNLIFGGRMSEKAIGWTASAASGAAFVVSVLLA